MSGTEPDRLGSTPRGRRPVPGTRSDLDIMLLPFFPDDGGLETFTTEIDGYRITMRSDLDGGRIATSSDRKILNLIAGQIGYLIRLGKTPSRHVRVEVRDLVDALAGDGAIGGKEYERITEKLQRLASTRIVAEKPLSDDVTRERQFNWIDAFEQDVQHTPGGRKIIGLKISLSEDAFDWITRNQGFDMAREEFQALSGSRASSRRIWEICLASLVRNNGQPTWIPIDELRRRVPITSDLKVFKARTLKLAMTNIAENEQLPYKIKLTLERKKDTGFRELLGKERVALEQVYVCVRKGPGPLPEISQLIPDDIPEVVTEVARGGSVVRAFPPSQDLRVLRSARQSQPNPHELPLFRNRKEVSSK